MSSLDVSIPMAPAMMQGTLRFMQERSFKAKLDVCATGISDKPLGGCHHMSVLG